MPEGDCVFLNTGNVRQNSFDFSNLDFITKEKDNLLRNGKLKRLSAVIDNATVDTTYLYYITKELEGIPSELGLDRNEVKISICFDSKHNKRKEIDKDYKGTRDKVLTQEDFDTIDSLYDIYAKIYSVYRVDGYEADDLIASLVKYTDNYDKVYVMSPDKDLIHLVSDKVAMIRTNPYKQLRQIVDRSSYEEFMEKSFSVQAPYNSILLYLSTVGDTADNIKGIKGFGKKAFNDLISSLSSKGIDYSSLTERSSLEQFIKDNFDSDKATEALESLELVYPIYADISDTEENALESDRLELFRKYNFKSLLA